MMEMVLAKAAANAKAIASLASGERSCAGCSGSYRARGREGQEEEKEEKKDEEDTAAGLGALFG